jgi:hypothetical protein
MHLDKDDLGAMNDTVVNADGSKTTIAINREVVTIRGIIKGEYTVNGHYYSVRSPKINKEKPVITVRVELHKVNPYTIAWVGEKTFTHRGQEETFLRFRLDQEGKLLLPFTFEKKKFVTPLQNLGNIERQNIPDNPPQNFTGAAGEPDR